MLANQPLQRHGHNNEWPEKPRSPPHLDSSNFANRSVFLKGLLIIFLTLQLLFDLWVIAPSALRYTLPSFWIASDTQVQQTQATNMTEKACVDAHNGILHQPSMYSSLTPSRVQDILSRFNHRMTYVPTTNTVFVTMAKAGSTTFWQTTYLGFTGKIWDRKACGYIHNQSSPCWNSNVIDVLTLPTNVQFEVLYSNDTTRVAIQREPFSRLLSGYKNKLMCGHPKIGGPDVFAQNLRIHAKFPPGDLCMNISEFADIMDTIRTHVGQPGYMKSWKEIDKHFMPQNFYADEIYYHTVLDVEDLSNNSKLAPFFGLLPFAELAKKAGFHKAATKNENILLDDKSAEKLHLFAQLAVTIPPRLQT